MGCPVCSTRSKINANIRSKFTKKADVVDLIARIRAARQKAIKAEKPPTPPKNS